MTEKNDFYTHSKLRENIIRWYPVRFGEKVLLVSEPCQTIYEALQEMGAEVTMLPLDGVNAEFFDKDVASNNASNCPPVDVDSEKYDIILQIGVIDTGTQKTQVAWKERLQLYRTLLKEQGTLLLAVPNRMGLKYFAGCQDDNYDAYFVGPEGYTAEMTRQALSKKEYEILIHEAGFLRIERYYPYPDHLFPGFIYSDRRLPQPGELVDYIRNFNKDRYVLFDESRVFDGLLKEGLFSNFTNSFLFVCDGKAVASSQAVPASQATLSVKDAGTCVESARKPIAKERILYSKFSMGRSEKFQIRTDMIQVESKEENGKADGPLQKRLVRKSPVTAAAERHIAAMERNYRTLEAQARGTKFQFCPVTIVDGAAEFPWMQGESLQQQLQKLLEQQEEAAAENLILQYMDVVTTMPMTEAVDVDLIFSNILVEEDSWNVIDYEWTFGEKIPVKWIIYRALLYLSIELPGYPLTKLSRLMELAGITPEEENRYRDWEIKFQEYITGDTIPIRNLVNFLGNQQYAFAGNETIEDREAKRRMNLDEKDAKKLFFHLDRVEKRDGKAIIAGWACAKTKKKEYIPVHIQVFDNQGNAVVQEVERIQRSDVAAVLKADTDFPYWGFCASFSIAGKQTYTLRLSAGRCQQEIEITVE